MNGMKIFTKIDLNIIRIAAFIIFLFTCEAMEAQAGRRHRATRRRTAVVVSSATHSKDQQAQAAAATPAPVTAQAAPAPAQTTTPPPASTQALLPTGSVVTSLPTGCSSTAIGGEEYYICGANYYKAAYQEGTLVYVTVKPPT